MCEKSLDFNVYYLRIAGNTGKGVNKMSAKEELLSLVSNLTPSQVGKLINRLPELISLLGESYQPCHQEQTEQIA